MAHIASDYRRGAGQVDGNVFSLHLVEKFHLYQVIVSLYRSQIRVDACNKSGADFFHTHRQQ